MLWEHNSLIIKGGLVVDGDLLPSLYTPLAFLLLEERFWLEFLTPSALRSRLVAEDPRLLSQRSGSAQNVLLSIPRAASGRK